MIRVLLTTAAIFAGNSSAQAAKYTCQFPKTGKVVIKELLAPRVAVTIASKTHSFLSTGYSMYAKDETLNVPSITARADYKVRSLVDNNGDVIEKGRCK